MPVLSRIGHAYDVNNAALVIDREADHGFAAGWHYPETARNVGAGDTDMRIFLEPGNGMWISAILRRAIG